MSPDHSPGQTCARCRCGLVSERGAAPWCPGCEWLLDTYEPERRPDDYGWARQQRFMFRLAYRQNARQFTALAGRAGLTSRWNWPSMLLTTISVAILALVVGLFALGVLLIVATWPDFRMSAGVVLIAVAMFLVPRFGRLDPYADTIDRGQAPELHRLIDEVATVIGVPSPDAVQVNSSFNASTTSYGFRRRRALHIGLPMWAALRPQQRVALLGHELAHFAGGDVRRGPLTSLAFGTFGNLSLLTRPDDRRLRLRDSFGPVFGLGELVANIVMGVLHHVFGGLQAALTCVALRSTQRAEYHADVAASRAAGTGATTELLDALVTSDVMHTAVRRAARLDPAPVSWQASAQAARAEIDPLLPRLRQLSLRDEASLLQTHPPSGLRVRMLHVSEPQVASVVLTDERADRIDVELASSYGLARRDMVHV